MAQNLNLKKVLKFIPMKKLRLVAVTIVLLLFCPFIKQCDGMRKTAEKPISTDSTAIITSDKVYNKPLERIIEEPKKDYFNELKTYLTEDSENVFDLSIQIFNLFEAIKKNEFEYRKEDIGFSLSIIFSTLLIITSFFGAIRIFKNKLIKTNWFYILNILFVVLIVVSNMLIWLDRFGQIKIGFYLLLLSNFYMLYLLKQKKEQIQL